MAYNPNYNLESVPESSVLSVSGVNRLAKSLLEGHFPNIVVELVDKKDDVESDDEEKNLKNGDLTKKDETEEDIDVEKLLDRPNM